MKTILAPLLFILISPMNYADWESWPASEEWYANHTYSRAYFKAGKFLYLLIAISSSRAWL
jgi:hypothetical protein